MSNAGLKGDPKRYFEEYAAWEKSPEVAIRLKSKLDLPCAQLLVPGLNRQLNQEPLRILEVGFLTGRLMEVLETGYSEAELYGIEPNEFGVKAASERCSRATLLPGCATTALPESIPTDLDGVVASLVLNLLDDDELRMFLEQTLPGHLREDAKVVLSVPHPVRDAEEKGVTLKEGITIADYDSFGGGEWPFLRTEKWLQTLIESCGYSAKSSTTFLDDGQMGYLIFACSRK